MCTGCRRRKEEYMYNALCTLCSAGWVEEEEEEYKKIALCTGWIEEEEEEKEEEEEEGV